MSNAPRLHLTMLDELAAKLPRETRYAILLDLDAFERDGVSRDGPLRDYATKFYQHIHRLETGFDASYLTRLGMSCHKLNSIEAIDAGMSVAKEDLLRDLAVTKTKREQALEAMRGADDQPATVEELETEIGRILGREDLNEVAADRLTELIGRARAIFGMPEPTTEDELAMFQDGDWPEI